MTETAKKPKRFAVKVVGRNTFAVREYITTVDAEDAHLLREYPPWTVINAANSDKGNNHNYIVRKVKDGYVWLHQLVVGAESGEPVQHINGDSLDNRKCNLMRSRDRVIEIEE